MALCGVGEYIRGKWRTVQHFCQHCFRDAVIPKIEQFEKANSRPVVLEVHGPHPSWLHRETGVLFPTE